MKKLLVIFALLITSCQKDDECKTCKWIRYTGHQGASDTVTTEEICGFQQQQEMQGKWKYVYDSQGNWVNAQCDCGL